MPMLRSSLFALFAGVLLPLVAGGASKDQKIVFLMLGPPGSGKTTQAKNLSGEYDVPSFSMSEILKEAGWVKTDLKKT